MTNDKTPASDAAGAEGLAEVVLGLLQRTASRKPDDAPAHLFPDEARQILAALAAAPTAPAQAPQNERVRHVKRGTEYEVLGEAEAQITERWGHWVDPIQGRGPCWRRLVEGDHVTVYRDPKTSKLWCRLTDEFRDGRFVTTDPAQVPEDVLGYATRLVQSLCDKHYPNPEWRPLPDLYGVLTQIDNMTCGLVPSRPVDAGGVKVNKALGDLCEIFDEMWASHCKADAMTVLVSDACKAVDQIKTALARQAPDKAGEREGVAEAFDDAAGARDEAGYSGTPASCIRFLSAEVDRLEKALATQPTGTEASRPVGGERCGYTECAALGRTVCEDCRALAATPTPPQADKPQIADVLAAVKERNRIDPEHDARVTDYAAIEAMTEAPPQADSTGQGDEAMRAWLATRLDKASRDSDAHPAGSLNRSFYNGQAIAYENALDALGEPTPSQADAQTQEGGR